MSDTEDTKEHNDIEKPKTPSDSKDDTENQEVTLLINNQTQIVIYVIGRFNYI